jgi:hypothetical protein
MEMGILLRNAAMREQDERPALTRVYGHNSYTCACGTDTYSTCRECGRATCGRCLDTPQHLASHERGS